MTSGKLYEKVGVKLSPTEILALSKQQAAKHAEIRAVEDEKSESLNTFNARLKTLEAEEDDLAGKINSGEDSVDIEVKEEPDDGRKLILTLRVDNGQCIKTRPMTLNEMAESTQRMSGNVTDGDDEASDTDPPEAETSSKAKGKGRKGSNGRIKAAPAVDESSESADLE